MLQVTLCQKRLNVLFTFFSLNGIKRFWNKKTAFGVVYIDIRTKVKNAINQIVIGVDIS